ncbi:MAG: NAD(+)/NADH kinase [Ruminococcaceae bacterium]|nr:NAD(+)/NADH kinase [Oscillospiraceae bacterium]
MKEEHVLSTPIKTVSLLPNRSKEASIKKALEIADILNQKGVTVKAPEWLSCKKQSGNVYKETDAIIVFGGDGTVLNTALPAACFNVPILSINTGKIGYLTALEENEFFDIDSFLAGNFDIERRMMIDCEIIRNGISVFGGTALNEVVVSKGSLSRMMYFRLYCGTKDYMEYRADAIIVSTPTGSTAYSMSAGGAVIDPSLDCIQVTPICPYTLSGARHMIFSPNSQIRINVTETNNSEAWLTEDGRYSYQLESGDDIILKRSQKEVSLIKLNTKSFCDILVTKLNG